LLISACSYEKECERRGKTVTTWWLGLAALAVLMVGLLLVLLWWLQGLRRQTELALGPDAMRLQAQLLQGLQALDVRLQQLERSSQSTQMTVAKSDGALDRVTQHVQTQLAQAQQDALAATARAGGGAGVLS
jgi:DNA recombination protein RmuC